ncbi:hypothetical protein KCP78_09170 [Salmonella enterica subsp. enterica]|nr:hypothetical protein KCP78_09170 [Salmonella enterica subsp. enterica]
MTSWRLISAQLSGLSTRSVPKNLKVYPRCGTCARSGQCCTVTEAIPPGTRYHINAFTLRAAACKDVRLAAPRDRKTLYSRSSRTVH